jgi:hypothetical protein
MEEVSSRLDPSHALAQYEADGGGCDLLTESIMGIGEPLISILFLHSISMFGSSVLVSH